MGLRVLCLEDRVYPFWFFHAAPRPLVLHWGLLCSFPGSFPYLIQWTRWFLYLVPFMGMESSTSFHYLPNPYQGEREGSRAIVYRSARFMAIICNLPSSGQGLSGGFQSPVLWASRDLQHSTYPWGIKWPHSCEIWINAPPNIHNFLPLHNRSKCLFFGPKQK